jgi:thiamine pyrophosphokinase
MKKVLILCNGNPPRESLLRQYRAKSDYFIAADGGGNIARKFKLQPDVVIGDLDSYTNTNNEPFDIIHEPDQNANDLEKALAFAKRQQATHVHILGGTGQRLDHTLKNLSVLKQFHNQFHTLRMRDNFGETRLLNPTFTDDFSIGTQLSLFPLSGRVTGITTSGLKYPLEDDMLENGIRDGSSNEAIDNHVMITHKSGDLLLFVAK